jgi:hypothetical protein
MDARSSRSRPVAVPPRPTCRRPRTAMARRSAPRSRRARRRCSPRPLRPAPAPSRPGSAPERSKARFGRTSSWCGVRQRSRGSAPLDARLADFPFGPCTSQPSPWRPGCPTWRAPRRSGTTPSVGSPATSRGSGHARPRPPPACQGFMGDEPMIENPATGRRSCATRTSSSAPTAAAAARAKRPPVHRRRARTGGIEFRHEAGSSAGSGAA